MHKEILFSLRLPSTHLSFSFLPFLPPLLASAQPKALTLPDLAYGYGELEPVISGGTCMQSKAKQEEWKEG